MQGLISLFQFQCVCQVCKWSLTDRLTNICLGMTWGGWNGCLGWQNNLCDSIEMSCSLQQPDSSAVFVLPQATGCSMHFLSWFFFFNRCGPFATTSKFYPRYSEFSIFCRLFARTPRNSAVWCASLEQCTAGLFPASVHMKAPLKTSVQGLVAYGLTTTFDMQLLGYLSNWRA